MINRILDEISTRREMTPDLFKTLHEWRNLSVGNHEELSDNQFKYACHCLHMQPDDCTGRLNNIMQSKVNFTKGEAQRIAVIEELMWKMDFNRGELIPILIDPKALIELSRQGMELYHKRQKWRTEYPGTEAWLEQIKQEMGGAA